MSEILQANIFFFITGIAVIVFTFLLCIALYHTIRILKSLRRVMDRIEEGSEIIADDMQQFRTYFTERSFISRILRGMLGEQRERSVEQKRPSAPTKKGGRQGGKTELKIKDE